MEKIIKRAVLVLLVIFTSFRVIANLDKNSTGPDLININADFLVEFLVDPMHCYFPKRTLSTSSVSLPAFGSDYLQRISQISAGFDDQSQKIVKDISSMKNDPFSAILLSNQLLSDLDFQSWAGYVNQHFDVETRIFLTSYYSVMASRCRIFGNNEDALNTLEIGLAILPNGKAEEISLSISRRIGEIYYYNDQIEKAEPWLRQASLEGYSPLILLSRVLLQQNRYEEALPIYIRALHYYPNDVELRIGAARSAYEIGDRFLSREILTGVYPSEGLGISGLILLAQICEEMDDFECAGIQYRLILTIDKNNKHAKERLTEIENVGSN